MKLRYDPFQVFRLSKTPVGLYARQKWLGEAETPQWNIDFKQTVAIHLADQSPDGSWSRSTIKTIQRLFGLHLTVRSSTTQIDAALSWLLGKIALHAEGIHAAVEDHNDDTGLEGLPFITGRPEILLTGAALFLSSIFGHQMEYISGNSCIKEQRAPVINL